MPNFNCPLPCGESSLEGINLMASIQQSIADEYEAAFRYRMIAAHSQDARVKSLFEDIAKEEIVHVGEFTKLLNTLFPGEEELVNKGIKEAEEKIAGESKQAQEPTEQAYASIDEENQKKVSEDEDEKEKLVSEIVKKSKDDGLPSRRKIKIVRV